jgi:hypothetical protein
MPLGQDDHSHLFQIHQKLYGREAELSTIMERFAAVSAGATELLLVSGYSGIGKSSLVNEVYKPITQKRGYFIAGKFDQFQRNVPYSAIIRAFRELVRQLLTESAEELAAWRERLLNALGPNGSSRWGPPRHRTASTWSSRISSGSSARPSIRSSSSSMICSGPTPRR